MTFYVFVRTLGGNTLTLALDSDHLTISDLQLAITSQIGIIPVYQRLFHKHQTLTDPMALLKDCDIKPLSYIYLLILDPDLV
nr:ORF96 [Acipenserid herpesvirus 1]